MRKIFCRRKILAYRHFDVIFDVNIVFRQMFYGKIYVFLRQKNSKNMHFLQKFSEFSKFDKFRVF